MNLLRRPLILFEGDAGARSIQRQALANPGDTDAARRVHRRLVHTGKDREHMEPLVKNAIDSRTTTERAISRHRTTVARWIGEAPGRSQRFRGVTDDGGYSYVRWDKATDAHDLARPDSETGTALNNARQDRKRHQSRVRRAASLMGEPVGKYHPRMTDSHTKNGVLRHVGSMSQLAGGERQGIIRHRHPHLSPISTSHRSWFTSEQEAKDHASAIKSHDLPGTTKIMQKGSRWGVHFTPHEDLETA